MKWIAALLLIVNVAVYLWASGKSVSVEQTTMYAKPDVNREGMLLLEEVRRDPFTAMAGTGVNLDSLPTAELDGREITGVKLGEEGGGAGSGIPGRGNRRG